MEWGNFWSSHLPRTSYDVALDDESPNRNEQGFEKMISRMYLGNIARRVLLRMSQESDVFADVAACLAAPFSLSTPMMSAIHEDDSTDLREVGRILKDNLQVTHISSTIYCSFTFNVSYYVKWEICVVLYPGDATEDGKLLRLKQQFFLCNASLQVNGFAQLHNEILKSELFADYVSIWPTKFQNKTNGNTPRRWLIFCNPELSDIISKCLKTDEWITNLDLLTGLRQEMSIEERKKTTPRTIMLGGKAFATYTNAKTIVKLVNDVGAVVNNDPDVHEYLKTL